MIFKLFLITADALEIIVKLGIIISLLLSNSKLLTAISRAAVPLDTKTQYFFFKKFLNLFSNSIICGQDEENQPLDNAFLTLLISCFVIKG